MSSRVQLFYSNGMALASPDPMAKRPDIELVALSKRFGDTVAVDSINLKIPAGSYCCLLGPSGCGKTTPATAARVFVQPRDSTRRSP
jgi:ABC-type branched-subunit amino acid transport system ATPase component